MIRFITGAALLLLIMLAPAALAIEAFEAWGSHLAAIGVGFVAHALVAVMVAVMQLNKPVRR